jgi:L-ascorbate metabolism protein UlaG (beta-lactamase superfamily)
MTNYYLKPNIGMEPLVNQWYASPFLISPVTSALSVVNSHLKIMESYVKAPQIHEIAVQKPEMLGGPYIDYPERKIEAIQELITFTQENCQAAINFAEAIRDLTKLLEKEATGESLEGFYERIPEPLKGYVELTYDRNNRASFRPIEALLYDSEIYLDGHQSVLLTQGVKENRPFCLSTPRLENSDQIAIKIPFHSPFYDQLFSLKEKPQPQAYLDALFDSIPNRESLDKKQFWELFTTKAPTAVKPQTGEGLRIQYFGHACVAIESEDCSLIADPCISYEYNSAIERYTYANLPEKLDYVLLTHAHADHVQLEHLLQLRYKIGTVIVPRSGGELYDPSLKLMLEKLAFPRVIEMGELETIEIPGGSITGIPFLGEHGDLNIRSKIAYLVRQQGKQILLAADSNNIEPRIYERLSAKIGTIDALFVGMECEGAPMSWAYGSLLTNSLTRKMDNSRRLNGSDAKKALAIVESLNCQQVYVYALGLEPWLQYIMAIAYNENSPPIVESNQLIKACQEKGIHAERLFAKKEIYLS